MGLFETINTDMKVAMKAKEKEKLATLRAIKAQLLLLKTSGDNAEISEEVEIKTLQKMVKQRKDSAEIYQSQGREELYSKEMLEVSFIEPYLPAPFTDEELVAALTAIIEQVGANSPKDMGKVMGLASKQLGGKADGKTIAAKVKQLLS